MKKISVLLLGVLLPSLSFASPLKCTLMERVQTDTWEQTDFQVGLDAGNNASQTLKGKASTSQLTIANGVASWKLQGVSERPQFDFTIAENSKMSFQYNPSGHPESPIIIFDCVKDGISGAAPPPPKSFHCNFHESLGVPGNEKQSDQAFDIPYISGQRDFVYIPKAKLLNIYGVVEMWGGSTYTVFETNGNTVEASGIGPMNHDTELSWSPQAQTRASVHCQPVY